MLWCSLLCILRFQCPETGSSQVFAQNFLSFQRVWSTCRFWGWDFDSTCCKGEPLSMHCAYSELCQQATQNVHFLRELSPSLETFFRPSSPWLVYRACSMEFCSLPPQDFSSDWDSRESDSLWSRRDSSVASLCWRCRCRLKRLLVRSHWGASSHWELSARHGMKPRLKESHWSTWHPTTLYKTEFKLFCQMFWLHWSSSDRVQICLRSDSILGNFCSQWASTWATWQRLSVLLEFSAVFGILLECYPKTCCLVPIIPSGRVRRVSLAFLR